MLNKVTVVATNTQFSIAVHLMAALGYRRGEGVTSSELAASVNTSASFVRRVLAKLSRAGLVETAKGPAGACWLARDPGRISLLEIYQAVGAPKVFAIHQYAAEQRCAVSCNIKTCLETVLDQTQKSMENSLKRIRLSDVLCDLKSAE